MPISGVSGRPAIENRGVGCLFKIEYTKRHSLWDVTIIISCMVEVVTTQQLT